MQVVTGLPGTYDRYSSFTLVEFEKRVSTGAGTYTSTFYRFCNAPQDITYNGAAGFDRPAVAAAFTNRTFPNPVVVSDGNLGNVSQLAFDDFDDLFKILSVQNDMLDWQVRVWEAGVDVAWAITWIKLRLKGRTEDQEWNVEQSDTFSVDVGSTGAVVDTSGPREVYGPTCRFVREFKRGRCLASNGAALAATTCDGSLPSCIKYGNDLRYGGFPDSPNPGSVIGVFGGDVQYDSRSASFPPVRY